MNTTSFLLVRLAIGASMLGHGLVRLPKLVEFSHWMVSSFEKSMLPKEMVLPFSYFLPVAEFSVGIMIISGLFTKMACIAGGMIMVALILGTALCENWEALPSQLIHAAFFAFLLNYLTYNSYAVENLISK